MSFPCHRCGSTVGDSDLFCPNCGAPQLRFEQQEEAEPAGVGAESVPRPPVRPQGIYWRDAIVAALMVAIPAGIICSVSILSWGSFFWVIGGGAVCIGIYRRRVANSLLDTRSGFRIGIVNGLIAAYTTITVTAAWRVFQRYALGQGKTIDTFYDMIIQQSTALVHAAPEAQEEWHAYVHFLLSPDGRAAYALMNAVTSGIGIVLFSAVGGALGVRLFSTPRRRP